MMKDNMELFKEVTRRNEQQIKEFCDFHGITLDEYKKRVDMAILSRMRYSTPKKKSVLDLYQRWLEARGLMEELDRK